MSRIKTVTAFVDWNSQIHAVEPGSEDAVYIADATFRHVTGKIARVLKSKLPEDFFDVSLRLYHGWHRGFEVTANRKALIKVVSQTDFSALSPFPNIQFRSTVNYGDLLSSALNKRLHVRLNCHLPNTLRKDLADSSKIEEKLVDTAIASDVVDAAYRESTDWLIVVGEDDDLIPPVFVAEAALSHTNRNIGLIRKRNQTPFYKLENLRYEP